MLYCWSFLLKLFFIQFWFARVLLISEKIVKCMKSIQYIQCTIGLHCLWNTSIPEARMKVSLVQGWEFDLSIFSSFALFDLLNDQPWSNRSRRSFKKIDRDRIALIDLLIRLIVIDLIFRSQKISNSIEKCIFCMFLTVFPLIFQKIESLPSIFSKDRRDRFALIDLWKRSTVIEWIPLIFKKDRPWANQSRRSFKK